MCVVYLQPGTLELSALGSSSRALNFCPNGKVCGPSSAIDLPVTPDLSSVNVTGCPRGSLKVTSEVDGIAARSRGSLEIFIYTHRNTTARDRRERSVPRRELITERGMILFFFRCCFSRRSSLLERAHLNVFCPSSMAFLRVQGISPQKITTKVRTT